MPEEAHLGRTYGRDRAGGAPAHRHTGTMQFNPQADVRVEAGDVLIAMGERQKLKQLERATIFSTSMLVMMPPVLYLASRPIGECADRP
jgi:hypothetical protein